MESGIVGIAFENSKPLRVSARKVGILSGQNVFTCFQCGKCSSGCPMADNMDLLPNQVIREIQLDNIPVIMSCNSVWCCTSCFACAVRCPKGIDLSKIMEAVRILQMRDKGHGIDDPSSEDLSSLPQIALISHFRKLGT